jgi:hypothetical protein
MSTARQSKDALSSAKAFQTDVNRIMQDRSQYRRGGSKAQGFAKLSAEENREVASKGGKMGHILKRAHEWTPEEARAAGRIGGAISRRGKAKK